VPVSIDRSDRLDDGRRHDLRCKSQRFTGVVLGFNAEIVDRDPIGSLDHVKRHDIRPSSTQGHRQRSQNAGLIRQRNAHREQHHGPPIH
jgi:hypothetical protein